MTVTTLRTIRNAEQARHCKHCTNCGDLWAYVETLEGAHVDTFHVCDDCADRYR